MDASILVDEAAAVGGDVGNVDAGAEIAVGRADSAETTRSAWASWDGDADGEKGTIAMEIGTPSRCLLQPPSSSGILSP